MDLNKAKRFLDKINREFGRMVKDPDDIARIDRDILMDYVRDFYDALLSEEKTTIAVKKVNPKVTAPPPAPKRKESRTVRVTGPKEVRATPTPKPQPKPVPLKPAPKVVKPKPRPVVVTPPPVAPPPPVASPPAPKVKAAPPRTSPALNASAEVRALFEFGAAKELSERLVQPVTDIWKAIGLNDRLLYTKELFGGSQDAMKKTVGALNTLKDFDEAKSFLIQTVAVQNDWGGDTKAEFARDFVKTVRRRFL